MTDTQEEIMDDTIEDPVCGMQVSRDSFAMEHLGIHYAFCSQQCQDRFKANPHLYIGVPGEQAPKQKGLEIVKQRRFRLEQPLTDEEAAILVKELGAMMGIKSMEVTGDTISITYDLLQATAEQIEARIGEVGGLLGTGWAERLQRGFVHYIEECEAGNLEATPYRGYQ
jgi:YHS domain-containing protein